MTFLSTDSRARNQRMCICRELKDINAEYVCHVCNLWYSNAIGLAYYLHAGIQFYQSRSILTTFFVVIVVS